MVFLKALNTTRSNIPGPSSEGTRSLVQYSLLPNFWPGRYPPMDCIFCLILFILVAQIGVPHYVNHFRNGLLCLGETILMSCLDSCGHLGLCVWSLHKYYEKLVPICNWRLCLVVFVITNLDSKPPDWERAGQVCPEGSVSPTRQEEFDMNSCMCTPQTPDTSTSHIT